MTRERRASGGTPPLRPASFDDVIREASPPVRETARALQAIVRQSLDGVEEGLYGGGKVRMALYSIDGPTRVVCGIQPGRDRCLFFLHRVTQDDVPELRLTGKGKHARQLAFATRQAVPDEVICRLVRLSAARLRSRSG